jgi:hypothetical protein
MTACTLTPPQPIADEHHLMDFDSGEATLDEWLRKRALKNSAGGASRCFVIYSGKTVVGYYSLSAA